jgi:hypothetical protein
MDAPYNIEKFRLLLPCGHEFYALLNKPPATHKYTQIHMKTTTQTTLTFVSIMACLSVSTINAQTTTVVDPSSSWSVDIGAGTDTSTGLNTATPSFSTTGTDLDDTVFWGSFSDVTLDVGDTVTYGSRLQFTGASTATNFRLGLFNDNGDNTPKDGGWTGFWTTASGSTAGGTSSASGATSGSGLSNFTESITQSGTFDGDGTYDFSLSVNRTSATEYSIGFSFIDVSGGDYSVAMSTDSITYTLDANIINTIAFQPAGAFNATGISVIPEPSSFALLAGFLGLASVMLRRRR